MCFTADNVTSERFKKLSSRMKISKVALDCCARHPDVTVVGAARSAAQRPAHIVRMRICTRLCASPVPRPRVQSGYETSIYTSDLAGQVGNN